MMTFARLASLPSSPVDDRKDRAPENGGNAARAAAVAPPLALPWPRWAAVPLPAPSCAAASPQIPSAFAVGCLAIGLLLLDCCCLSARTEASCVQRCGQPVSAADPLRCCPILRAQWRCGVSAVACCTLPDGGQCSLEDHRFCRLKRSMRSFGCGEVASTSAQVLVVQASLCSDDSCTGD